MAVNPLVYERRLNTLAFRRSLIALSLIMALLQFKPTPMYILDEVDAALDLSHTPHISFPSKGADDS